MAEHLLEPADPQELAAAIAFCHEHGLEWRILGGGANLIIADGLLPGVTLATERLRRTFRYVPREYRGEGMLYGEGAEPPPDDDLFVEGLPRLLLPESEDAPRLVAWAGSTMPGIVNVSKRLGWSGVEGLAGVPGSVGGGVAMNAGGAWGELWDVIERVRVIDERGEFEDIERANADPGYRNGGLGSRVVAGVVLKLEVSTKAQVEEAVRSYLQYKRDCQPVTEASAGCMFRNPDAELSGGKGAGVLIEEAGLKGERVGGAMVSPKHANFVVNAGGATASDVLGLVGLVEQVVAQRTGINLMREVKVWGA